MSGKSQTKIILIITAIFGLLLESAAIVLMVLKKLPFPTVMPVLIIGMFMALAPAIGISKLSKNG
jgi:hypothetical protein